MASYLHGIVVLAIRMAYVAVLSSDVCPSLSSVQCPCPQDWQFWQRACYRQIPGPDVTWPEAWAACKEMSGVMTAPSSIEENQFVFQMVRNTTAKRRSPWIGCRRRVDNDTEWECDGQSRAKNSMFWRSGQPNNVGGIQDCVVARRKYDWLWDDGRCDQNRTAVCVRRDVDTPCPTNAPRYCVATQTDGRVPDSACLLGHVTREFVTQSIPACGMACVAEPACRSFNVKKAKEERKICQLNNATKSEDNGGFQATSYFCIYFEVCG